VNIARALGVTVEYLVTGREGWREKTLSSLTQGLRSLLDAAEKLNRKNRKLAVKLIAALKEHEDGGAGR
jgi:hypothetical protein